MTRHNVVDARLLPLSDRGVWLGRCSTLFGPGVHNSPPSTTSRYFGVNTGLLHIAALDLNNLDERQLAWLEQDLIAANKNRAAQPWIMVTSHFPLYHTLAAREPNSSLAFYLGDEGETFAVDGHDFMPVASPDEKTVGDFQLEVSAALEPLLMKYGVDIYNAGHVHDYESTWPMYKGKICAKSFNNPKCPLHITEGNGGVPGVPAWGTVVDCEDKAPWCRVHGTGGNYGRMIFYNASVFEYHHVNNSNPGDVTDSFVVYVVPCR